MPQEAPGSQRFRLPDGNYINVPSDYNQDQWEALYYRLSEVYPKEIGEPFYESQRTNLGRAATFALGIPRGALGLSLTALQGGLGLITPGVDLAPERGLRSLQSADWMSASPEYRDTWANKIGTGIGSLIPFVGTAMATMGASVPVTGAALLAGTSRSLLGLGVAAGMGEQTQRVAARNAAGEEVSGLTELLSTGAGGVVGLSEVLTPLRLLKGMKLTQAAATTMRGNRILAGTLGQIPKGAQRINTALRGAPSVLGSALMEGTQEATAMWFQDAIAHIGYDPDLKIGESWLDEFLVGGIVGGLADVMLSGLANRRGQRAAAQVYELAREISIMKFGLMDETRTAHNARQTAERERRAVDEGRVEQLELVPEPGVATSEPINVNGYRVVPSGTGRGFFVLDMDNRDKDGNPRRIGAKVYENETDARSFVVELERLDTNLLVAVQSHLTLRQQGMDLSPTASGLAQRAHHPEASMFPTIVVAQYEAADPDKGKSQYESWSNRSENSEFKGRSMLTAEEVVKSIGIEAASVLFYDKAGVSGSGYLAAVQEINRIKSESGMLPDLSALKPGFLHETVEIFGKDPDRTTPKYKLGALNAALKEALAEANLYLRSGMADYKKSKNSSVPLDPAFMYFSKVVTGEERWGRMSSGQKALLITEISKLQRSPIRLQFPDLSPIKYAENHRAIVVRMIEDGQSVSAKSLLVPEKKATEEEEAVPAGALANKDLDETAVKQLLDHLSKAGVVSRMTEDKDVVRKDATGRVDIEDRTPADIDDRVRQLSEYLPEGAYRDEIYRYLVGQFRAASEAEAAMTPDAEVADPDAEAAPKDTAEEKATWVTDAMKAMAHADKLFREKLNIFGSIKAAAHDVARNVFEGLRLVANGSRDGQKMAAYSPFTGEIAIHQAAVDPEMVMSVDELEAATLIARRHEIYEALISRGYLTDAEIEAVTRAVDTVVPASYDAEANAENKTWKDLARAANVGATEVDLEREASGDLWAAYSAGLVPKRHSSGIVNALFKNLTDVFKAANSSSAETRLRGAFSVFERILGGHVGKRGPGRDFINPEGEIRNPRYIIKTAISQDRARAIKEEIGAIGIMRRSDTGAAPPVFGSGENVVEVSGEVEAPVAEQRELFDEFLSEVAPRGFVKFLSDEGIENTIESEVREGPEGVSVALHMTLPTTTEPQVLKGVAKLLGDALLQGTSETRVVVPFEGSVESDAMFGVTLQIPDGTNIADLTDRLTEMFSDFSGSTFTIDRMGDQVLILDERSTHEQYDDGLAIEFVKMMRNGLEDMDIRPNGFFVNVNQYAHEDFYDGDLPDGVESFEGGLNDLQAQHGQETAKKSAGEPGGLSGASGRLDLQRSAINNLYELAARAAEQIKKDGELLVRPYTKPGSAIDPIAAGEQASEGRRAVDENIENTPPGYVPLYGDVSDMALEALMEAAKFGAVDTAPEIGARFSTRRDVPDPAFDGTSKMTEYESEAPRSLGHRIITFLDSPDKWSDVKEWLTRTRRLGRYSALHRRMPEEELVEKVKDETGHRMLADESAYGAAMLLWDRVKATMVDVVKIGPTNLVDGLMVVSHEGFVTKKGDSYRGLREIWALLEPAGTPDETFEIKADELRSARRGLSFIKHGEAAAAALAELDKDADPDLRKRLEKDVLKGSHIPGYNVDLTAKRKDPATGLTPVEALKKKLSDRIRATESNPRYENIIKWDEAMDAVEAWQRKYMVDTGLLSPTSPEYLRWEADSAYVPWTHTELAAFTKDFLPPLLRDKFRATGETTVERERVGSSRILEVPLLERTHANIYSILTDGAANVVRSRVARELDLLGILKETNSGDRSPGVIKYRENGEEKWFITSDPLLANSLAASANAINMLPAFARMAVLLPASWMRELITRSPDFWLRQSLRDAFAAYGTTGAFDTGIKGIADAINGYRKNVFDWEAYQRAVALGISIEYDYRNDPDHVRDSVRAAQREAGIGDTVSALKSLWDGMGVVSKMQESAIRLKVYDRVKEETGNEAEAILQAHEVINFGRRGANPYLALFMAMTPFLNARLQGLDVMYRSHVTGTYNATDPEMHPDEVRARAYTRGLYLSLGTLGYWMLQMLFNEDEYVHNTKDTVKQDNWLLPFALPYTNHQVKVPIAFEVGVFYKTIPELFLNALFNDQVGEVVPGVKRAVMDATNVDLPQFIKPLVAAYMNKDVFGEEITPSFMEENLPRDLQYRHHTTMLARGLGSALTIPVGTGVNINPTNPMMWDHLMSNYLPGIGMYILSLADAMARKVGGESAIGTRSDVGDPINYPAIRALTAERGGGLQEQFYELQELVDKTWGGLLKVRNEGRVDEYKLRAEARTDILRVKKTVDELSEFMSDYREARDRIRADKLSSPSKRRESLDRIDAIRDQKLAIVPVLKVAARGKLKGLN